MRSPPPQTYHTVAVAALLVLAGCSGFGLGGGGTDEPNTGTMTPAPVPATASPTETSDSSSLANAPPGVGPDGIENRIRLLDAFEEVVKNRTYSVTVREFDDDGAPVEYTYRVEDEHEYTVVTDGGATDMTYVDSRARFDRDFTFANGEVEIHSDRVMMSATNSVSVGAFGQRHLAGSGSVDIVERNGSTYYRIRTTSESSAMTPGTNYTRTAYVRPDGFIKTIDVAYDQTGDAPRVERRWTFALDTGPVTEPDWATRTRNGNLSAFSAGEYPPGIDESGLRSYGELWTAHRTHLAVQSFTLTRSGDLRLDGLVPERTIKVANRSTYAIVGEQGPVEYVDPGGHYELRDGLETETTADDRVTVDQPQPFWVRLGPEHGHNWLRSGNSRVERVTRNGSTLFRVTATRPPLGRDISAENFTMTAFVRPGGLIREIRIGATVVNGTQADGSGYTWAEKTYRYRYHDIGATTVSKPDWLTAGVANRTATPAE